MNISMKRSRYSEKKYVDLMDLNDDDDITAAKGKSKKSSKKKNRFFEPVDKINYDEPDEDDINDDEYSEEYDDDNYDEYDYDEEDYDDEEYDDEEYDDTVKAIKSKRRSSNRQIAYAISGKEMQAYRGIIWFFVIIFILLSAYFIYFVAVRSKTFANNPYNPRLTALSSKVIRGSIYSSDGQILASNTTDTNGNLVRTYPFNNEYAHAVGYATNGMAGIELSENFTLLSSSENPVDKLKKSVLGEKLNGDSVVTTLDSSLQDVAFEGMKKYDGAAIAIDPDTGKILLMVSKPDFDPNIISQYWSDLVNSDSSVLLNRATQGLYPPGSTFKILTALEYLDEGKDPEETYTCKGKLTVGDYTIHCASNERHGTQNVRKAFANSCNVTFATIGLELNASDFMSLSNELLFNTKLPTKLSNTAKSKFSIKDSDTDSKKMQTAIGQSDTLVSPIHMCMISSAIANDGILYEPYIVDHVVNANEITVSTNRPTEYKKLLSETQVNELSDYMRYAVTNGTARKLKTDSYEAYGKTGTAEYSEDKDKTHSWFTGYAMKDGKKIAVAIIMEGAGSGSKHAVPLAKEIFDKYFSE